MGRPLNDLTGKRFGRWTVLRRDSSVPFKAHSKTKWICRCDCGTERSVWGGSFALGRSDSCGCLRHEQLLKRNTKHGLYGTKTYSRLQSAKRHASRLRAIPKWANEKAIQKIYAERPMSCDVDHIVPLRSHLVCGLHWEGNLQYLPSAVNQSKKNRYWPQMEWSVKNA